MQSPELLPSHCGDSKLVKLCGSSTLQSDMFNIAPPCVCGGGGGVQGVWGGTLIFSYMRTGFQKNEYFGVFEDFVDNFGGHHNIGLCLGVISMHFRVFS